MIVTLRIIDGPRKGIQIDVNSQDVLIFGRAADCHIRIKDDPYISRHHFVLEISPPEILLRDLGGLNGTQVNDERIVTSAIAESLQTSHGHNFREMRLFANDIIQAGQTRILIEHGELRTTQFIRGLQVANEQSTYINFGSELSAITEQTTQPLHALPGYTIKSVLGEGGMGIVYLATAESDMSQYAIKLIRSSSRLSEEARKRFFREIEIQKKLKHESLVETVDVGFCSQGLYLVMAYCKEGNLNHLVQRLGRCLSYREAIPLFRKLLSGLAHVHSRGIVHRDLKPPNILLDSIGDDLCPRIADFGLAKSFHDAGLSGLTHTGSLGGTLEYMPPEQVTNFKYVNPASDVWALAATVYFSICGVSPRDLIPMQDPVQAVLENPVVPVAQRLPSIPVSLARVFDRALHRDPGRRYPDARALLNEVNSLDF